MHNPHRHRMFQLTITFGVIVTALLSVIAPEMTMHPIIAGTLTNLIWIWEW